MTTAAPPTIELRNVSKWYGDLVAVADLTLALGPGVTGLLGRNGAGKTTTLKLLTGLLRPSLGEALAFGRPLRPNPSLYRSIGVALDGERLYPNVTVRAFVRLHADLHGLDDADAATEEALLQVDAAPISERRLGVLSKGQKQRAKIAGALVNRPSLLVMDEPMSGMDPVQRASLIELVRSLADQGVTVIVSSHILAEVEQLASRVVVLVNGRLAASGDVRGIRALIAERQPHTVRIRTADARRLAACLVGLPSTVGVRIEAGTIEATTRSLETLGLELPRLARSLEIGLEEVRPSDDSLEDVFQLLVER